MNIPDINSFHTFILNHVCCHCRWYVVLSLIGNHAHTHTHSYTFSTHNTLISFLTSNLSHMCAIIPLYELWNTHYPLVMIVMYTPFYCFLCHWSVWEIWYFQSHSQTHMNFIYRAHINSKYNVLHGDIETNIT